MVAPRAAVDPAAVRQAVRALEGARRDNRRRRIDIWEAIYQAYLVGFSLFAVMALGSAVLPSQEVSAGTIAWLDQRGGAAIGMIVSLTILLGLRSGAHGGPLAFDEPTVQHILQSPVDRPFVTRRTAVTQVRTMGLWGALVGVGTGLSVSASLPGSVIAHAIGYGIIGTAAGAGMTGAALIASGRRISPIPATLFGSALVVWSAADLLTGTVTAPQTMLGALGLPDIQEPVIALVPLVIIAGMVFAGVMVSGGLSLEASRRRAGLVSQIRFALTMQDLRTVVLLRRRMAQSGHRAKPWIPVPRSTGLRAPFLRRTLHSVVRLPGGSLVRIALLLVASATCFAVASHTLPVLALLPGLFLFVIAYDVLEPLAQEADHPTRWTAHPLPNGLVVTRLTAAGFAFLVPLGLIAAIGAAIAGTTHDAPLAFVSFGLGALGATAGAAVATMLGGSTTGGGAGSTSQSEVFGMAVVMRIALPIVVAVVPFAPTAAALGSGGDVNPVISTSLIVTGLTSGIAWMWLSYRSPAQ